MEALDSRDALSKARFFLKLAERVPPQNRFEFEAHLEAALIFGRSALLHFEPLYKGRPGFGSWWQSLLQSAELELFRTERNFAIHEGPARLGQKVFAPSIGPAGQHIPAQSVASASELYYIVDPAEPATTTMEKYLDSVETTIAEAQAKF